MTDEIIGSSMGQAVQMAHWDRVVILVGGVVGIWVGGVVGMLVGGLV